MKAKALLVIATVLDLALAALLIGVSGFLFGGGPNAMKADALTTIVFVGAVIGCVVLPIIAFIINKKGKAGAAQLVAWLPVVVGFLVLVVPVL
ncbi:MAG: hypothetical protein AB7O50_08780 [Pseudolabrys sp.]